MPDLQHSAANRLLRTVPAAPPSLWPAQTPTTEDISGMLTAWGRERQRQVEDVELNLWSAISSRLDESRGT